MSVCAGLSRILWVRYKPMRQDFDVAMARHHCYEQTLIAKYGEMPPGIPVFLCGAMRDRMVGRGEWQARKRYSSKIRDKAMRLAAL